MAMTQCKDSECPRQCAVRHNYVGVTNFRLPVKRFCGNFAPVRASGLILGIFATVGMMFAARKADLDWDFTLLVGCCIGLACLQGARHQAQEDEKKRLAQAALQDDSVSARRRR